MKLVDEQLKSQLIDIRRDLHMHPELSWEEHRTADKVCRFLDQHGIVYRRGVAGTGVVVDLPGPAGLPFVALRADMDALPIQEETELPFASENPGVMHACGHDGHTTMLLGAAALLAQEPALPVPVRLIFQPAEETGRGAEEMIKAGVLDDVAMIFGGHLDRHHNAGSIVVTDGTVNASSDRFRIEIAGRGGHGARPHETVDAVVAGSLVVMAIQTIVSREVNPAHPSVISVGKFAAGSAPNVIASHAVLEGTIRSQDEEVRRHLHDALRRISSSVGQLHGATVEALILEGTPPLVNNDRATQIARAAAANTVGADKVEELITANMGGEDFSHFVQRVAGCYVRFGAQIPGKENYPAHSSRFDIDERALPVGAAYFHAVALAAGRQLSEKGKS
jgi:hippurate hydrolase